MRVDAEPHHAISGREGMSVYILCGSTLSYAARGKERESCTWNNMEKRITNNVTALLQSLSKVNASVQPCVFLSNTLSTHTQLRSFCLRCAARCIARSSPAPAPRARVLSSRSISRTPMSSSSSLEASAEPQCLPPPHTFGEVLGRGSEPHTGAASEDLSKHARVHAAAQCRGKAFAACPIVLHQGCDGNQSAVASGLDRFLGQ